MTEAERRVVLDRRFLVGDRHGIHHFAYRGQSKIVGFTVCRIGIRFKKFAGQNVGNWKFMRILKAGHKLNCVNCIAIGDELHGNEVIVAERDRAK